MLPLFSQMLHSSRQWLRQISPTWLNQEIQFPLPRWDPPDQEQLDNWDPYLPKQAFWERTKAVRQVLKDLGQTITEKTYPEIQKLVQQTTGTACSKKVISRFKREQGIPLHSHPLKKPIPPARPELSAASPSVAETLTPPPQPELRAGIPTPAKLQTSPDPIYPTKPIHPQRTGIPASKGFKPSTHSRSKPRQLQPRSP